MEQFKNLETKIKDNFTIKTLIHNNPRESLNKNDVTVNLTINSEVNEEYGGVEISDENNDNENIFSEKDNQIKPHKEINYKISLIVPCYNLDNITHSDDTSFEKTFNSIKNQTIGFENIELLLINNGSTDSTKEILDDLSNKYPNIILHTISKNTGGPSIPRNIGIKNATADYIMFLDADDTMELDCMEVLFKEITSNDVDIVKTNFSYLRDGMVFHNDTKKNKKISIEPKSKEMIYVIDDFVWGSIYSKKFLIDNQIYFINLQGEDTAFIAQCFNSTSKKIISINDYYGLNYHVNNNESFSHTKTLKQIHNYTLVFSKVIKDYTLNKQNTSFIEFEIDKYTILLVSSVLRSTENYENKKEMIKIVSNFINKFDDYDKHFNILWKIICIFFKYRQNLLIYLGSCLVNLLFNNILFKKVFRNK